MALAVLLLALIASTPAAAAGAGAMSFTQVFHNATQSFPVVNPCTGVPGTVDLTYDGAFHVTILTAGVGAGTGWATFTGTGSLTLTQTNGVVYTGHFTAWDGQNFNLSNFAATSILVIHATGSDGTSLSFHDVVHMTVNFSSTGPVVVVSFDKPSCG
jgi:hypothetical protein